MSPEQILGDKLDFRSDIFSVGIVLYQMVTGQKPFVEDESRTVMQKIRLDRFTPRASSTPRCRVSSSASWRCMEKMPAGTPARRRSSMTWWSSSRRACPSTTAPSWSCTCATWGS
ncbi:MAG: protein kinase [Sandaracinaceae bacterium]|nr:protein kinase [Sandaracinaceae bacterium]